MLLWNHGFYDSKNDELIKTTPTNAEKFIKDIISLTWLRNTKYHEPTAYSMVEIILLLELTFKLLKTELKQSRKSTLVDYCTKYEGSVGRIEKSIAKAVMTNLTQEDYKNKSIWDEMCYELKVSSPCTIPLTSFLQLTIFAHHSVEAIDLKCDKSDKYVCSADIITMLASQDSCMAPLLIERKTTKDNWTPFIFGEGSKEINFEFDDSIKNLPACDALLMIVDLIKVTEKGKDYKLTIRKHEEKMDR